MWLYGRNVIEVQVFDRDLMEQVIFPLADEMREVVERGGNKDLEDRKMITFFYEPSTRTRASFEIAMRRLGGEVIFSTENARIFSSVAKGETLEDTIRVLNGYHPDIIVLRSDQEGMAKRAAGVSDAPIVNAGDGIGEHPTQALLDVYTIQKEFGRIDGLTVALVGDLKRSRTVHSLARLLAKFKIREIYFVSPPGFEIGDDIRQYLNKHNVCCYTCCCKGNNTLTLVDIAPYVDVIYQTRLQKERKEDSLSNDLYEKEFRLFRINKDILGLMKKDAIIMHPLPRNEEISREVDLDRRAAYFRQAENGLYIRMALLKLILEKPSYDKHESERVIAGIHRDRTIELSMAAWSEFRTKH